MKALFIIPPAHAPMLVHAWNSFNNNKAITLIFNVWGDPSDDKMLRFTQLRNPDVIFYLGAHEGMGLPSFETLKRLRNFAPVIHLCWDAVDIPWHEQLVAYKKNECFDLQVSIDGARNSPVDFATLTPVDPRVYNQQEPKRTIRCGFSGQISREVIDGKFQHPRVCLMGPLIDKKLVFYRGVVTESYAKYAFFLRKCKMVINSSYSGSGVNHSVKARVVEVGTSGAALLESDEAPTKNFIPEEHLFLFSTVEDAAKIIKGASKEEVKDKAEGLGKYISESYSPQKIYESILERIKL